MNSTSLHNSPDKKNIPFQWFCSPGWDTPLRHSEEPVTTVLSNGPYIAFDLFQDLFKNYGEEIFKYLRGKTVSFIVFTETGGCQSGEALVPQFQGRKWMPFSRFELRVIQYHCNSKCTPGHSASIF